MICRKITHYKSGYRATDTESTLLASVYTDDRSRRFTMPAANSPFVPVYKCPRPTLRPRRFIMPAAGSCVRTGLEHQCRLSSSAPAYNAAADSSVCAACDAAVIFVVRPRGLVYINIPAAPVCMSCLLGMSKSQLG